MFCFVFVFVFFTVMMLWVISPLNVKETDVPGKDAFPWPSVGQEEACSGRIYEVV